MFEGNLLDHKTADPVNTFIVPFLFPDYIEGCVESIWKHCSPDEHRLIVINNACNVGSRLDAWLTTHSHLYIKSYRNLGCSKAWNMGIQLSKTDYWCLMGDDTRIIHKDWWPEVKEYMESNHHELAFCHPCHLTQPSKVGGELEPPEFTDEMWEETKEKSGDMVGRFNCVVINKSIYKKVAYSDDDGFFFLNEDLYPCYWVDRDFHNRMAELDIPKVGLHFPVWHMRAMTCQSGKIPIHDSGPSNSTVELCPKTRRHL